MSQQTDSDQNGRRDTQRAATFATVALSALLGIAWLGHGTSTMPRVAAGSCASELPQAACRQYAAAGMAETPSACDASGACTAAGAPAMCYQVDSAGVSHFAAPDACRSAVAQTNGAPRALPLTESDADSAGTGHS